MIPPINFRFSFSLANFDRILADIIASSPNATAVGPVNSFDKSLHLVFSKANFISNWIMKKPQSRVAIIKISIKVILINF